MAAGGAASGRLWSVMGYVNAKGGPTKQHRPMRPRRLLHLFPGTPVAADEHHAAADLEPVSLQFQLGTVGLVAIRGIDLTLVLAVSHGHGLRNDVTPDIVARRFLTIGVKGFHQFTAERIAAGLDLDQPGISVVVLG